MKIRHLLVLLLIVVFAASCGSKKKVVTRKDNVEMDNRGEENRETPAEVVDDVKEKMPRNSYHYRIEDYIRDYASIAQEEMKLYKIPASITLAQGILESGAGNGELTRRANNHFGIKCHDWKGEKVYHDDDRRGECFRKYKHAKYSYRDHSLFLSGRGRYSELFELDADDYKGWAKGLRKAGYATDRRYPDKLIDLIERYELYQYDSGKQATKYAVKPQETKNSETHVVRKGDTLYSISKKYNTSVEDIRRMNGLNGNTISIGQVLSIK
ncbi:glucosaminidase domain-containing protein [Christiangramia forsetii]|uniref:Peptidoglycan hydrolase n=2 Tax=Christiangramia forsetii TaxID=411153 RepID=A0LXY2_CHRFK|nr:glucosaminidase domain-containing protein [Christiangramia forsetii]GGG35495.1 hemagglutinin [Christiangramia forsetii]CAL65227.1 mannosyl-glycoprotein endo-beta-N-acetylglucosamidase family protein [Christiangramia forsetii KT0803]